MSTAAFTILCGIDQGENSHLVIERALAEAVHHPKVVVHFCTVMGPRKELSDEEVEEVGNVTRGLVEETLPVFTGDSMPGNRRLRFHLRSGRPGEQLLELAFEARADLVIVGGHGAATRNQNKLRVGEFLSSACHCSVQVVRVAHYDEVEEDYASCSSCIAAREESDGSRWFCEEHRTGRIPRLSDKVGVSSHTPGWGIF